MTLYHLPSARQTRPTFGLFLLLALSHTALAQTPAPRPTLAATLAGAQPPAQGVALAVGADKVKLPPDALLPGTAPTVAEVSSAYGRTTQRFGFVTAVAPPTMVVLNTAPGEPNIYAGMPALDALTLLCAGLTDGQWQALTSEQGLAVTDLDTPAQRQLFAALLSGDGKLIVRPDYAPGEKWDDNDKRDLSDALPQAHLRLGQTITLSLPSKDQPGTGYPAADIPPPAGAPRRYRVDEFSRHEFGGSSDSVYGATVRAEVPNVPKQGQLDFSAPALKMSVPLNGLKTVGDLVYRIGDATHTELYVDKRLEGLALVTAGTSAAPAADLLQALAFCLTGTFRQIGPAFVLTDDVVGLGTRKQLWYEFEQEADALRRRPVLEASSALYDRHTPRTLSWFGDPGTYSPEEEKAKSPYANVDEAHFLPELQMPLSQMTPAQQDMVRRGVEKWNKEYTLQPVTAEGKITVRPGLSVQLLVPSLDTPVDMNINHGGTDQMFLFQMSHEESEARMKASEERQRQELLKAHPELASRLDAAPTPSPPSAVLALLRNTPRRAALVHPRTAKEVDADVAAAATLGLNELWLDVFSDGVAHIPGSTLSPSRPLPPGESDILTEALVRTKGKGIRVFPVTDLLFWGPSPPPQATDLNVLGETSAQSAARWQQRKASLPEGQQMQDEYTVGGIIPDWPGVAVSPASADVRAALVSLVRGLVVRPGVAGLVWRDTDTPGYDIPANGMDTSSLLLGYHEAARLAFLRHYHADPMDVYDPGHYYSGKANTDLPIFGTQGSQAWQISNALDSEWAQFRRDTPLSFLRVLCAAANPPGTIRHLPLLLKQRRRGQGGNDALGHHVYPPGWYGSWDDPRLPPPTLHSQGEDDKPGQPMTSIPDETTQAKSQSRSVLVPISGTELEAMRTGMNRPEMRSYLTAHPMPGFVLDLDSDNGQVGPDPLVALAKSARAAASVTR